MKSGKFWQRNLIWFLFPIFCLFFVPAKMALEWNIRKRLDSRPPLTEKQASFHNEYLKRFHLGFQNAIAGLIWVQLLQEATLEPIPEGKVSWEFTQVDAVTELDPSFERAYSFGSIFLSVFKQDKLGAKKILERWVRRRPNYWRSQYMLGYHLYSELKDYEGGAKHILRAATLEHAPDWLSSLGIRLLSETGALAQSLKMAIEVYSGVTSRDGKERLKIRIRSLNFGLQKIAWNQALKVYRENQHREPSSLEEIRPLVGLQFRELASIVGGEGVDDDLRPLLRETFPFFYNVSRRNVESRKEGSEFELPTGIHVHPDGT